MLIENAKFSKCVRTAFCCCCPFHVLIFESKKEEKATHFMILYFKALIWIFFSCDRSIWNAEKMCGGCLWLHLSVGRMGVMLDFLCVIYFCVVSDLGFDHSNTEQRKKNSSFYSERAVFQTIQTKRFDKLQCHHGIRNILF